MYTQILDNTLLVSVSIYAIVSLFWSKRKGASKLVMCFLYLLPLLSSLLRGSALNLITEEFSSYLLPLYVILITISHVREYRFDPRWRIEDIDVSKEEAEQMLKCLHCDRKHCGITKK